LLTTILDFDLRVRLEFRGTQLSSDGGLLVIREVDDELGPFGLASGALCDGSVRQAGVNLGWPFWMRTAVQKFATEMAG